MFNRYNGNIRTGVTKQKMNLKEVQMKNFTSRVKGSAIIGSVTVLTLALLASNITAPFWQVL